MTRHVATLWLVLVMGSTTSASAHPLKPGLLRLAPAISAEGELDVMLKLPSAGDQVAPVEVRFPTRCPRTTEPVSHLGVGAVIQRWRIRCDEGGLASEPLVFEALSRKVGEVLILYPGEDGTIQSAVARAERPTVTLKAGTAPRLMSYLSLGIAHIILGIDHLLFVLGLMMLVGGRHAGRAARVQLLWTITSFTVAHSLTLGAATLGLVSVPSDAVETVIAMSIVLLAIELARPRDASPSWTSSRPAAVAFTFGLLHGFGFAGALTDLGVPRDAILEALLLFNLGVEFGQLAFVLAIGGLWCVLRRAPERARAFAHTAIVHALGGVAVYWCLERGGALLTRWLSWSG
jgi:hydrogenase/urease accessory protein HupE